MEIEFEEFDRLTGSAYTEVQFNKNVNNAIDVIHYVTGDFFHFNHFDEQSEYIQLKVKKAITSQIIYFIEKGANTSHGMEEPVSITIGRTSMSNTNTRGGGGSIVRSSIVSPEAISHLSYTGLLYRGVNSI